MMHINKSDFKNIKYNYYEKIFNSNMYIKRALLRALIILSILLIHYSLQP